MENNIIQQIIAEINFARSKPKEFAAKLKNYEQYFKGDILRIPGQTAIKTSEGFKAFKEAAETLENANPLGLLCINTHLTKIAEDAFNIIDKSGDADVANNINLDDLISKYGQIAGQFSQAVDFGSSTAELVAVNLIVDDGDQNRGNRANILNPKFLIIGVANGKHKTFHHCTVITYARHFIPTGEDPGNLSDDCFEKADLKTEKTETKEKDKINDKVAEPGVTKQKEEIQIPKYIYVKEESGEDYNLPKGIEKLEKQEKIIVEDGVKRKLIKEKKYFKDGSIDTNIYKVDI